LFYKVACNFIKHVYEFIFDKTSPSIIVDETLCYLFLLSPINFIQASRHHSSKIKSLLAKLFILLEWCRLACIKFIGDKIYQAYLIISSSMNQKIILQLQSLLANFVIVKLFSDSLMTRWSSTLDKFYRRNVFEIH